MKTAVSIPDDVFAAAEHLARRRKMSRSQLYAEAVSEYVARRDPEAIEQAMNRVCDAVGDAADPFVDAASQRILEQAEW